MLVLVLDREPVESGRPGDAADQELPPRELRR